MEALTLTRQDYHEGLDKVDQAVVNDSAYLDQFKIEFPEGLNTANTMEICRVIQDSSFESKVHLMRLCIVGKTVKVTCPNGEQESFKLGNELDGLEGFDLFRKDPLALWAIADSIYGYILKKYLRPSTKVQTEEAAPTLGLLEQETQ